MSGRSRIWEEISYASGPFTFSFTLPYNATLLQIIITWDTQAVTSEILAVEKDSGVDNRYDVTIQNYNPVTDGVTEYLCNPHVEFRKGDKLRVTYDNTDSNIVSIEACFREGD